MSNDFSSLNSFSPPVFFGRHTQLNEFLVRRQMALLQKGDEQRGQIDSIEKLKSHAMSMRKMFIEKLGGIPKRDCPLNARTVKIVDMGTFTIEDIIYTPRKDVYVTSSLYIPKGITKPSAAVLFLSGHTNEGRMGKRYQEVCQTLVNAGLIVFAPDPPGQGERISFYNAQTGEWDTAAPTKDHDLCGLASLSIGQFLAGYFLNEQMAAVDYMLTREEIDPEKIGVTGCSGGGLQSISMMTCDDRIAAAAPATFTTTRRDILYTCQSQDAEQIWPGCAVYGFDHFEPYIIFAPKPVKILTVSADFFPIEGAYEVYDYVKKIYSLYGKEENVEIYEDNACHEYTQPLAEQAAEFFCRIFGVERHDVNQLNALPIDELRATKSGNVKGDFLDAKNILDEVVLSANELAKHRASTLAKKWLREKVEYSRIESQPVLRIEDAHVDKHIDGFTGKGATWWVQKRLAAYGMLISKGENDYPLTCSTVIALWDNGTRAITEHEDWIKSKCNEGNQVLVVDLPGVGNIEQAQLWRVSEYRRRYGTFYKMCCDLMYMDDSMAAMQTYHIIRTVNMLKECLHVKDVSIYCDEQEGVYGIMAGYLLGLEREYGKNLLCSVEKQILSQSPINYDNTLSYIIPGMLKYFDYDELM